MQTDPSTQRPADLKRLGRYKIVRPLSKGGMALVYEARRESLAGVSPRVAIKLILPEHESSETFRELFINEARLGASMHHQNLVQIQDFDCDDDRYFLVMEYVEGLTLRRIISLCQRHGLTIPAGVVADLGRQACDGLHYAHCAKDDHGRHLRLVHRDIKPSNLILSPHGVVKVLDFGISKGRLRRERQGSVKGTWGYMAPEQAMGDPVWPAADVFGLAVVLYELAALRPMFQDKNKDEIKRLLRDDHAARMAATLDPAYASLIPVLVRALQRDEKARFPSAQELGRALSSLLPDPITARDEVTRFFEVVNALEEGRPVPGRPPESQGSHASQGSLMPSQRSEADSTRTTARGWVVGTVAASSVAAVMLLGVMLLAALFIGEEPLAEVAEEPLAEGTPLSLRDLVIDEPAGPAGEGAPGEERDPPAGVAGERRPPRAAPRGMAPEEGAGDPSGPADPGTDEEAAGEEPARVRVVRRSTPEPAVSDPVEVRRASVSAPVAPRVQPPEEVVPDPDPGELGLLVVGAKQDAEVYIAGQFVDDAPVRQELPPGRYAVSLVARDGRRRTFEVELEAGERIRKTWDFDRMEWR